LILLGVSLGYTMNTKILIVLFSILVIS